MSFHQLIELVDKGVDAGGVAIAVMGVLVATVLALRMLLLSPIRTDGSS